MWYAVTGTSASLHPDNRLADIGARLEKSFDDIREDWWRIGKRIGGTPTAHLAHMPTAASYNCDFGLMLGFNLQEQNFLGTGNTVGIGINKNIFFCLNSYFFLISL